ncbi:hypothetical protein GCM10027184_36180 [Saccharothrix stipae]
MNVCAQTQVGTPVERPAEPLRSTRADADKIAFRDRAPAGTTRLDAWGAGSTAARAKIAPFT